MPRKGGIRQLGKYRAKRDFKTSPEPPGAVRGKKARRQGGFCVQKHAATRLHYDLRLEYRGTLLSWAVPKGPSLRPDDKRLAVQVEDHPLEYADFEGVIPEGYGAGVVMLWDKGTWQPLVKDVAAALAKGELKFTLDGVKLKGSWVLVRIAESAKDWLLIKHKDEWSGDISVIDIAPLSVKTDRGLEEILADDGPRPREPRARSG